MLRLNNYRYTKGIQRLLNSIQYLMRHPLLHLQAAGKDINHARKLRQACNPTVRDIRYMCLPKERKHMMLAKRVQFNILHNHHLAIALMKFGAVQNILRVHAIALCDELHRLCNALRCLQQAFPLRVFTHRRQYTVIAFGKGGCTLLAI